ncbi:LysM peptidoglycan-binding domain-containing protein [Janthinobacterium sp. 64]|uniref:LysM peptidoglycan-binding domain-containing protein n=1 Tax=Janthinobacterium sp. 64 TaxID=2035208 RepID=UPI000C2B5410|nr:LysM peptidoglycan-binding domain-containing protein [Janthinobacterium sp. 64]PKB13885.1 YD repeat-containing protein [Janthinobacterium sp. 64]
MVAIVSGNTLGLLGGSSATLGQQGAFGAAGIGKSQENGYLNVSNGNIVMQQRDDFIASRGIDLSLTRTYNAQGALGQHWKFGLNREVGAVTGVVNGAGSTVVRIAGDGSEALYRYDEARGVYVSTDGPGAYHTLAYDAAGQRWTWSAGDGQVREVYDAAQHGRIISSADENNHQLSYFYDANSGLLSRVLTASGDTSWFEYSNGDLAQVRDVLASGVVLTRVRYGYDAQHRLTSVTTDLTPDDNSIADGKVAVIRYVYDGTSERIVSVMQADGTALSFTYQQYGGEWRVASVTDGLGRRTQLAYDLAANTTRVTDALGAVSVYAYDSRGQLTGVTTPAGQQSTYAYDAQGNLIRSVDARGNAVEMQYDANGNQILQRDALGNTITRTYDPVCKLLLTETTYQIADPDGAGPGQPGRPQTTRYVYDAAGHLRFQISPQGRVTEHRYDGPGARLTSVQYTVDSYDIRSLAPTSAPDEATMSAWEAAIRDKSTTTRTDYEYDVRGLLARTRSFATVSIAGAGVPFKAFILRYVYDQAGRLLQQIDKSNNVTNFAYDGLGRLLTTTDPLGNVILHSYDDAGGRMSIRLANGLTTTSVYNKAGELTDVIQTGLAGEELGRTSYAYDADGRLRMTTGPTGLRSYVLYDEAGRKAADIAADGALTQYQYDANNQLIRTLRYAQVVNGASMARLVAADGSPLAATLAQADVLPPVSAQDQNEWRLYDAASRLLKTVSATGAVSDFVYDGASRLVQTIARANTLDVAAFAAQPSLQNADVAAAAGDRSVWREYDDDGLLRFEVDADRYMREYGYDSAGRLMTIRKYTAPLSTLQAGVALSAMIPEANSQDPWTTFKYDGRGALLWSFDGDVSVVNNYDPLGRLKDTTRSQRDRTGAGWLQRDQFYYDAAGRVQSITRSMDGVADETTYTFDLAGNKVRESSANSTLYYRYDLQGRLIGALSAQGGTMLTALGTNLPVSQIELVWRAYGIRYEYDGAGTLIRETPPMTDGVNVIDGGRILHDEFGREIVLADAQGNLTLTSYDSVGAKKTWKQINGKISTAEYDARGLLITETLSETGQDASGALRPVMNRYSYDASGKLVQKIHAAGLLMQESIDYVYDQVGKLEQRIVVSNGMRMVFDGLDRITSQTEAQGKVILTTYHVDGGKTVSSSLNGVTTIAEYDAFGRLVVRTKEPSGKTNITTYEPDGSYTTTVKTADGLTTITEYDANDRVTRRTLPTSGLDAAGVMRPIVSRYFYDDAGRVVKAIESEGLVTQSNIEYEYDQAGKKETRTTNGLITVFQFDAHGMLTRMTRPETGPDATGKLLPLVNTYTYDAAGRVTQEIAALGLVAETINDYEYDQAGKIVRRTYTSNGIQVVRDGQDRELSLTDAQGNVKLTTYHADGGKTVSDTVSNRTTISEYDARSRLTSEILPKSGPDASGILRPVVNRYSYNAAGQVTQKVLSEGLVAQESTDYVYDQAGKVQQRTVVSNGNRTMYDALDRVTSLTDAQGNVKLTTYHADGRKTVSDTVSNRTTISEYDARSRLTSEILPKIGPDASGVLRPVVNRYSYNAAGQVTQKVLSEGLVAQQRIDYEYDQAGKVQQRTVVSNGNRTMYDALDRVTSLTDAQGNITLTTYLADGGRTVSVQINGKTTLSEYDARGLLTRETLPTTGPDASGVLRPVVNRYSYNAAGQVTQKVLSEGLVAQQRTDYVYDQAGKVQQRTVVSNGNRTMYDALDRVTSLTDAQGNITLTTYLADGGRTVSVQVNGKTTLFEYDARGLLTRETLPTTGPDASGVLLPVVNRYSYNAAGQVTQNVLSEGLVAQQRTNYMYDQAGKVQLRMVFTSSTRTVYDALDRVTSLTDAQGNITLTTYLADGGRTVSVQINGKTTLSEYDARSLLTRETLPTTGPDASGVLRPVVNHYSYNAAGQVTQKVLSEGLVAQQRTDYVYDQAGKVQQRTVVSNGNRTMYDALDRVTSLTDAQGNVTLTSYEADGGTTVSRTVNGETTRYGYDQASRLIKLVTSSINERYVLGENNQRAFVIDAAGKVLRYIYDASGKVEQTIQYASAISVGDRPALQAVIAALKPAPALDIVTNFANGMPLPTIRDDRGWHMTLPLQRWGYDQNGNRTPYVDTSGNRSDSYLNLSNGNVVLRQRDDVIAARGIDLALGRAYNAQGGQARHWTFGVSQSVGRIVGVVNGAGSTVLRTAGDGSQAAYTYDSARSMYVSTDGAGAYRTLAYDAVAQRWTWTAGDGQIREVYDATQQGRIILSSDTSNNQLSYYYDAGSGQLSRVVTASGDTTWFDYSNGDLTQVRDVLASGAVLTRVRYGYDAQHRLTSVTTDLTPDDNSTVDGKVAVIRYAYDGTSERIAGVTQADGTALSFTYQQYGSEWRVTSVSDVLGRRTQLAYDLAANTTRVTDALGAVSVYAYDAQGQLIGVTTPAGQQSRYVYDAQGNLIRSVDARGNAVEMQYDANGNQILQRDALGNTITRTYDPMRNLLLTETTYQIADPDGAGPGQPGRPQTARYVYDAAGHLRFQISAAGRTIEYRYNAKGERIASVQYAAELFDNSALAPTVAPSEAAIAAMVVSYPNKSQTVRVDYEYDARGLLARTLSYGAVDAAGVGIAATQTVQRYVYDQAGQLLQNIDTAGTATSYTYDGLGRLLTATDPLGHVTLNSYDAAGGRMAVRLANGLTTTSVYNKAGELTDVIQTGLAGEELGRTSYAYDADGRLRMTTGPTGQRTYVLYDEAGRKVADITAGGTLTQYQYDANNQLIRTVRYAQAVSSANLARLVAADGTPLAATLAQAGVLPPVSAKDQGEWRLYDAAGRLVRTVGATGAVTEYVYDGVSKLVQTIARSTLLNIAAFAANPVVSNAVVAAAADDRITWRTYDADGLLRYEVDGERYMTEYRYDSAGRQVSTLRYANQVSATALANGSLAQATPAAHAQDIVTSTTYNGRGLVDARIDGEGYVTSYSYDAAARLAETRQGTRMVAGQLTQPGVQQRESFSYDANGRLSSSVRYLDGGATESTTLSYDSVGNVIAQTRAGVGAASRYDLQGRLIGALAGKGSAALAALGSTPSAAQVDAVWQAYGVRYTYDKAGLRIAQTDANGNRTLYLYDADARLTHAVNALGEVRETVYNVLGETVASVAYGTRLDAGTLASLQGGMATPGFKNAVLAIANPAKDSRTSYSYLASGALASSIDALDKVTTYGVNTFGEQVSRLTPIAAGVALLIETSYDRRGQVTGEVRDRAGVNQTSVSRYDAFGRLAASVDANQVTHGYDYDRNGHLVMARDGLQQAALTSYDAYGNVLTQTDRLGQVTRYSYTAFNRSVTVTTPEGLVTVSSLDAQGRKIALRDAQGVTSTYHYDLDGNLDASKAAEGSLNLNSTNSYDAAGRLTESVDAGGRKVRYEYDAANRLLTRRVDPDGLNLRTSYQYDAKGQQIQITDPAGAVTQTEFDLNGKVFKQIADPQGLRLTTQYAYDDAGRVLTVTSPAGLVTSYVYDKLGRRTEQHVDPAGLNLSTLTGYDAKGNVVSVKDPNRNVTRYLYDANDRLVLVVDAKGGVTQTLYDKNGNVVQSIGYAKPVAGLTGKETAQQILSLLVRDTAHDLSQVKRYDKDGRLSWSVDGSGAVVRTEHDGKTVKRTAYANRLDAAALAALAGGATPAPTVAAGRDVVTQQLFDAAGRLVYSIDGVGAVQELRYDGSGNAIVRIAYAAAINITQPLTLASVAQQLATIAQPARDARLVSNYDGAGRLTYSADAQGAVTQYGYDKAGHLTRQIAYATALPVPVGNNAVLSSVAQSTADRISSFTYDALGRQVYAVDAMGGVTRRMYDNAGNVVRSTAYAAQLPALLDRNSVPDTARILALLPLDTQPASHVNRVFDSANRLLYSVDALGYVTQNTYDANGHVTRVARYANTVAVPAASGSAMKEAAVQGALRLDAARDVAESRIYDAAGRLQEQTRAAGSAAAGTIQYAYDALGNITSITNERGYVTRQEFDQAGRKTLTSVPLDGTDSAVTRTSYDAFGNAVKVTDPKGNAGYFYYDQQNRLVLQVNPLGYAVGTSYTLSGKPVTVTEYKTALTGTWSADARPTVIASAGDAITRLEYDRNDRLLASIDAEGAVERFDYDALGNRSSYQNKLRGMTRYTYDGRGALLTETLPVNAPDASGALKPVINSYTYDAFGNRRTSIEAQGLASQRSTTYGYDLAGRLVSQRGDEITLHDSSGATRRAAPQQTWTYDQRGNKTSYTDGNDKVTRWYYDAADRKQMELSAAGTLSQWRYDAAGNMVSALVYNTPVSAPAGNGAPQPVNPAERRQTYYDYDQANRMVGTRVGNSDKQKELNGDPVFSVPMAERNEQGSFDFKNVAIETKRTYDALGNVVSEKDGRGTVTWSYYNTAGAKIAQVDGKNYLTVWTRDAAGNILQEYRYAKQVSLVVNAASSVEELKASSGTRVDDRITVSTYDRMNRAKSQSTLNQEVFSLDTKGVLSSQTRATAVAYDYDGLGNIIKRTEANGDVTDTLYDALGRQTRVEGAGFTDFQQAWVRPTTDTVYDGVGHVITSTALGKTHSEDRITRFIYDAAGILTGKSTDGIAGGYAYGHDAAGNVTQVQVNGRKADGSASVSRTLIGYDAMGRETRRQTGSVDQAGGWLAGDSREVRYNAFGDIVFKGVNGGTAEFAEYDIMGRRWKTNAGDGSTKVYQYDQNGNATVLIQSSGANLRPMTLEQILAINEIQDVSKDPVVLAAKAAGGISVTLSTYDKRNQLTDTYQATMQSASNFVTNQPFLTQELGVNFTAGGLTVGATRESGGNVTSMPTVTGSIGYAAPGTVYFGIVWLAEDPKSPIYDQYEGTELSQISIPFGLINGPGKIHVRIDGVEVREGPFDAGLEDITWYMRLPTRTTSTHNFRLDLLQESQTGSASSLLLLATTVMSTGEPVPVGMHQAELRAYGAVNVANQINIRNQPTSTSRLVFMRRQQGSNGPWSSYEGQQTYNNQGGAIAGWFHLSPGYFVSSGGVAVGQPDQGNYEYQYVALAADGTVLNVETGVYDSAQGNSVLTQTAQAIYGTGKAFQTKVSSIYGTGDTAWLNITEQGKAQSMRIHYRAQGTDAWQVRMLEAEPGIPGWFKMSLDGLPACEYWFETYTGPTGTGAQVNAPGGGRTEGTFTPYGEVSALTAFNAKPASVTFNNQPTSAVSMRLFYTGPDGIPRSKNLDRNGANSFIWNASDVAPDVLSSSYVVKYSYEVFDASGQRVNAAEGVVGLGKEPIQSTHKLLSQPSIVSFTPPVPAATQMILQYRSLGSTGAYTRVVLPRSGDKFIWKVEDAGLRPQSGSNKFEYSYTLLDVAGQPVTDGKPSYDGVVEVMADRTTSYSFTKWTMFLKSGEATIHRQQAYNAFGEIASETDGQDNVVALSYNTAGKLTRKEAPMTTIALENGSSTPGRPVTLYYYDASSQLIGVRDANGNLNTQTLLPGYGSEGRIVSEFHADGGVKKAGYDVFGDLRTVTDELQRKTQNRYDQGGRLIEVIRPERLAGTPGYNNGIPNVDRYTYDTQGNRISHTNAYNQTESTDYDAEGRVVRTLSFEEREVRYSYTYDAAMLGAGGLVVGGWKKVTTVGNVRSTSDSNDYFGHLVGHVDVAGRKVVYSYDHAAHLIRQTSSGDPTGRAGQNIDFEYYANGYLKRSTDRVLNVESYFEYDKEGNRTREAYAKLETDGQRTYYQLADISYDELNRVVKFVDPEATITYSYDANSNRRQVKSAYNTVVNGAPAVQDYWYQYDSMNRFTITKGVSANGMVSTGSTGTRISYDLAGQRLTATAANGTVERYSYTSDGYLEDVTINGVLGARRENDLRGRVTGYSEYRNGVKLSQKDSVYDADNRVTQESFKDEASGKTTVTDFHYRLDVGNGNYTGVDQGVVTHTFQHAKGVTDTGVHTMYSYVWWDEAKQSKIQIQGINAGNPEQLRWGSGFSDLQYDVNGHLTQMSAYEAGSLGALVGSASSRTMTYISDQYGQVLRRNKTQANGNLEVAHRFYYLNGHTIGDVSSEGPSTISYAEELAQRGLTTPGGFRNAKPVSSADFDQNYQPINSSYPGATASAYTVRKGDTLGAIARAVWGDESLWYLLADANGLTISDTLIEGQVLTVPNKVSNFHNNASTFKVYNAGQAIGDTMPVLPPEPMPPPPPQQSKGGGCGVMGKLIMVVVAVVVVVMTAGAAATVLTPMLGSTMATVAGGAIGGALGSIASQTVGMAIGAQDGFNWNGVALGALGGAVSAGVMNTGMGPTFSPGTSAFVKGAVQGGISNTITQGVAVATGLQHSFDWRGVAAGAIAGGVFAEVGNAIGQAQYGEQGWANLNGLEQGVKDAALWSDIGKTMARGAVSGVAAGMASGLVRGGSLRNSFPGIMQDVIASTVGNAIGLGAQVTQRMAESVATDVFGNVSRNWSALQNQSPSSGNSNFERPLLANSYMGEPGVMSDVPTLSDMTFESARTVVRAESKNLGDDLYDAEMDRIRSQASDEHLTWDSDGYQSADGVLRIEIRGVNQASAENPKTDTIISTSTSTISEASELDKITPSSLFFNQGFGLGTYFGAQSATNVMYTRSPLVGGYGILSGSVSGYQAHHLNQNAVYKASIAPAQGLSILLRGNAFTESGSPHYEAHASLERWWDNYRGGGSLERQLPTNADYGSALKQSLIDGGMSPRDSARYSEGARQQRLGAGHPDAAAVPRLPRRIYQSAVTVVDADLSAARGLAKNLALIGRGAMVVGAASDGYSFYSQYQYSAQTGDYSNTYREGIRITGGWAGAAAVGTVGAEFGAGFGMAFTPAGAVIGGFVGGIVGGAIGYFGGSYAAVGIADDAGFLR